MGINISCIQKEFQFRKCNKEVYHLKSDDRRES